MRKLFSAIFAFSVVLSDPVSRASGSELEDWQIWHQDPASDIMRRIEWFDAYTLWFIGPIALLVTVLLTVVVLCFRKKVNPVPSKTTHNATIEVIWTVIPLVILVMIAIPSFALLKRQIDPEGKPDLTIKATGYQWYWGYEYQDGTGLSFDSVLIGREKYSDPEAARAEREEYGKTNEKIYPYLLSVDNELVVPVGKTVRVLVTGGDVIHSFTVPSLGFKIDAVPGRMNETWFRADREGLFYGQCSELCGKDHAFMPIAVRVVSQEQYDVWKFAASRDLEMANRALLTVPVEGNNHFSEKISDRK